MTSTTTTYKSSSNVNHGYLTKHKTNLIFVVTFIFANVIIADAAHKNIHQSIRKTAFSSSLMKETSFVSPQKFIRDEASGVDDFSKANELAANAGNVVISRGGGGSGDVMERLKIGAYFGLWYALNVVYNIVNKKVLNVLPAPLSIGTIQFGIGALYVTVLWLLSLRAIPKLTPQGRSITSRIGFYHASGQLLSMISLGAGPVSFTHIVKALEPFFSALVSALMFGKWMAWQVYATLLPVVGGVGYACLKERSFSWVSFYAAMSSNFVFALRAVVSKAAMTSNVGENMNSVNLFGVVTIFAFLMSIPAVFLKEGLSLVSLWKTAVSSSTGAEGEVIPAATTTMQLARAVVISGLFHYLNNEVMYLTLSNVHPVTLAVGNTMKRVFIMVASVLVFRNPVSLQAGIGAAVGISGVLLYSLTKQHYEKLEQERKESESA